MIKTFFMRFLALCFPWLALLIEDNPGGALVALIMQATVIGWLPASIWAWRTISEARKIELAEKRKTREAKRAAKTAAKEEAQAQNTTKDVKKIG